MMIAKPASAEEESIPAFAQQPQIQNSAPTQGSVEDLQRRLAMIGNEEDEKPPAITAPTLAAPAPVVEKKPAAVQGGKNALLARIMAAKEKSQQAQAKVAPVPPPSQPEDLLLDFDAPASEKDPPPSYNTNFLQQPPPSAMAPPAFDAVENTVIQQAFPPPPPIDAVAPPPMAMAPPPPMMAMAPPAASAPSFESLMVDNNNNNTSNLHGMQAMAPPQPDIDDSILAALSPEEREALLEEQRQIMEQIEKNKQNNEASSATARAMAFNQRSSAAVAQVAASMDGSSSRARAPPSRPATNNIPAGNTVDLGHGEVVPLYDQKKTEQAIKDGTALIVQCMSCNNWMQVTETASLMLCPHCGVVVPVDKAGAATSADMEGAAQLAADAKLAEELQKEEYKKAGGSAEQRPRRQKPKPAPQQEQSWFDWLTGTPAPAPAAAASNSRSAEVRSNRPTSSGGPRLVAAQTGDETQGLISRTGGGARVAQQKSMFACVADSVTAAAGQMTAYTLTEDGEGNVHGVDSSSLLAMPDVSRQGQM